MTFSFFQVCACVHSSDQGMQHGEPISQSLRKKIAELRGKAEKKEKNRAYYETNREKLKKLKKSEDKAESLTHVLKHVAHSP